MVSSNRVANLDKAAGVLNGEDRCGLGGDVEKEIGLLNVGAVVPPIINSAAGGFDCFPIVLTASEHLRVFLFELVSVDRVGK